MGHFKIKNVAPVFPATKTIFFFAGHPKIGGGSQCTLSLTAPGFSEKKGHSQNQNVAYPAKSCRCHVSRYCIGFDVISVSGIKQLRSTTLFWQVAIFVVCRRWVCCDVNPIVVPFW
jgi:hypothetical protein